jgi:hypothetical protein
MTPPAAGKGAPRAPGAAARVKAPGTPYARLRAAQLPALVAAFEAKAAPMFWKGVRHRGNGVADAFWLGFDGMPRNRIRRGTPASIAYDAGRQCARRASADERSARGVDRR